MKSFAICSKFFLFPLHFNSCFWPPTPKSCWVLFLYPLKKKHKPSRTSPRTWPDSVNQSDTFKCQQSIHLFASLENSEGDLESMASTSRSWKQKEKRIMQTTGLIPKPVSGVLIKHASCWLSSKPPGLVRFTGQPVLALGTVPAAGVISPLRLE